MSLLEEYQKHERQIGRWKIEAIDYYLKHIKKDLSYDMVVYNKSEFDKFNKWFLTNCQIRTCYNHNMDEVSKAVIDFTHERDWDQFHSPENLAKSIAIESGELLECFQWGPKYDKKEVCEELADVVNYSILLADKLGVRLEDIVMEKLEKNRKKYPVEKAKGKSTKYTKL
jgi:NTP pyrophosphatase (non-canonical NTP hydrolase)